jgi:predicted small lipoprotein YifL
VTVSIRGRRVLFLLIVCAGVLPACGKKGPPLPPMARVPSPPASPQAARVGDEAYIWFGVPAANVSGEKPADLAAIELYAFTGTAPPPGPDPTRHAVKLGTYAVQPPQPPPPPAAEGAPPPPPMAPGFVQGATAVLREALTPDTLMPTEPRGDAARSTPVSESAEPLPGPLIAPDGVVPLKRYYFLVATSTRGRASSPSAMVSVPTERAGAPPEAVTIDYTATGMTVAWTPSAEARGAPAAAEPGLLAAKPLTPPPPPTGYFVFDAPRQPAAVDPYAIPLPAAVNQQPVTASQVDVPGEVRFGVERCFVVRAVDTVAGAVTMGHASEPVCVTPVDTFPPAPPQRLAAISGVDVINLIWEANSEPDLAGYIVLRGTAPGDTLQALTPAPIRETTYRDQSVRAGERYVYAVVAVDNATPQNVSGQSNRVEESSRAPR